MFPPLLPMLAVSAQPFDSAEHGFEIKWDGVRALAAVQATGWRLWGREQADYTSRYPELEVLREFPAGTLVDGELVALREGLPDLSWLLRRHLLTDSWKIRQAHCWCPVLYVLFDLLYLEDRCLLHEPWALRRELLAELCRTVPLPGLLFSAAVVGPGKAFFEAVVTQGHEGVMAKSLAGTYRPGRRSAAWRKIKPAAKRLSQGGDD
jgi:ATP-dependent DNA ligase